MTSSIRTRISDERGGEQAFRELCAETHGSGLGILLDVVPNHMAAVDANRFWADPELRERFFDVDPVSGRHRRFFDIDDLAGLRIEREDVFATTHALILRLVDEGVVDALRIDHPDGLADPAGYLERLHAGGARRVWVEKILASSERLPADWAGIGHRRLRVPQRRLRAVRRSGRGARAERPLARAQRRPASVRRVRAGRKARAGAHDVHARGRATAAGRGRGGRSSAQRPQDRTPPTPLEIKMRMILILIELIREGVARVLT